MLPSFLTIFFTLFLLSGLFMILALMRSSQLSELEGANEESHPVPSTPESGRRPERVVTLRPSRSTR